MDHSVEELLWEWTWVVWDWIWVLWEDLCRDLVANGVLHRAWLNGAVALVLAGFGLGTWSKPMPQQHWTTPDGP